MTLPGDQGVLVPEAEAALEEQACGHKVTVDVAPLALKLDYRPRGVDARNLRRGDFGELLQAFALERVEVATRRCRVVAASPKMAWDALRATWTDELGDDQLHRFVAGASVLRPLATVGAAARDAVVKPGDAKEGQKLRTLRREAAKCGAVVACESARGARRLVSRLSFALDSAADAVDAKGARKRRTYADMSKKDLGLDGLDAAKVDRRKRVEDALDAVHRGLHGARDACASALHRPSPVSVAKAAPVAILRNLAGASRGVAILLVGLEAEIDADDDARPRGA